MGLITLLRGKQRIVTEGLDAYYRMDEGSGTTLNDLSGNGNDGTFGAAAKQPSWVTKGVSFDGGDTVVLTGLTGPSGDHTIMIGIDPVNATAAAGEFLFDSEVGRLVLAHIDPNANDNAAYFDGAWREVAPAALGDQVIALRLSSSTGEIFRNSVSLGTAAYVAKAIGSAVTLGSSFSEAPPHYNGVMFFFLYYSRALSDEELLRNYRAIKGLVGGRGISLP